jgi:hypothetical protein
MELRAMSWCSFRPPELTLAATCRLEKHDDKV